MVGRAHCPPGFNAGVRAGGLFFCTATSWGIYPIVLCARVASPTHWAASPSVLRLICVGGGGPLRHIAPATGPPRRRSLALLTPSIWLAARTVPSGTSARARGRRFVGVRVGNVGPDPTARTCLVHTVPVAATAVVARVDRTVTGVAAREPPALFTTRRRCMRVTGHEP